MHGRRGLPDREKLRFDPLARASRAEMEKREEKNEKKNNEISVIEVSAAGNRRIARGKGEGSAGDRGGKT